MQVWVQFCSTDFSCFWFQQSEKLVLLTLPAFYLANEKRKWTRSEQINLMSVLFLQSLLLEDLISL